MTRRWAGWRVGAALSCALAWAPGVRADGVAACLDAAAKGQTLRDAHKLVEAREQFLVCAASSCPAAVKSDCALWLSSVETSLPTVVLVARDASGSALLDVLVSVDGRVLADHLDGQSVPIDPGLHTFIFTTPDGTRAEHRGLVVEGLQNQPIAVVLGSLVAQPPGPAVAPPPASAVRERRVAASPWRTVGWALGGVGVVSLGIGAVFGAVAIADKNNAHCQGEFCEAGPLGSARTAATASNVCLAGGAALVLGGAALVIFAPRSKLEHAKSLRWAPWVGPAGIGAVAFRTF